MTEKKKRAPRQRRPAKAVAKPTPEGIENDPDASTEGPEVVQGPSDPTPEPAAALEPEVIAPDGAVVGLPTPSSGSPFGMVLSDAITLGKILAGSGFFKDVTTEYQAVAKILAGIEHGIAPITAMSNLYVIDGKVSIMAGLVGVLIRRKGFDYRVEEHDELGCKIQFYRIRSDGEREHLGESTFTMVDAEKAGLLTTAGGKTSRNWKAFPRNMLFARALTNGARWYTPDVFGGAIYTPDELGATLEIDAEGREAVAALPSPTPGRPRGRSEGSGGGRERFRSGQPDMECQLHRGWFFEEVGKGKNLAHAIPAGEGKDRWCNARDVGTAYPVGTNCPSHPKSRFFAVGKGKNRHGHKYVNENGEEKWCMYEDLLSGMQDTVRQELSRTANPGEWLLKHVPDVAERKSNIWTLTDWYKVALVILEINPEVDGLDDEENGTAGSGGGDPEVVPPEPAGDVSGDRVEVREGDGAADAPAEGGADRVGGDAV